MQMVSCSFKISKGHDLCFFFWSSLSAKNSAADVLTFLPKDFPFFSQRKNYFRNAMRNQHVLEQERKHLICYSLDINSR